MDDDGDRVFFLIIVAIAAMGVLMGTEILTQPYFEARAFNKFSATKATYWDAVFADLRILPDKETP